MVAVRQSAGLAGQSAGLAGRRSPAFAQAGLGPRSGALPIPLEHPGSPTARLPRAAQPLQFLDNHVEPLTANELHRVIQDVALLTDLEDGHDIRVMEPCRRPGLVAKPLQGLGVAARAGRENLECHLAA